MNSINLAIYKIQKAVDGVEVYETNTGSTSPLAARYLQAKLIGDKSTRKITYTPPNDIKRSILLPQRHFEILAKLAGVQWHAIESLKSIRSETRKPVADMRTLGLIIHTDRKKKAYRLRGEVELYPLGLGLGIPTVCELLPTLTECLEIENQKAKAEIAKRISRAKRTADMLEGG
ncbi:MAG: hypothetical protein Q8K07_07125 [Methylicorpusculum sp.]|uniref:hypothetical protein n=1 Tax=Methylicorpusculum sp. TaxID=2713644 RepID=UPI00272F4E28|nr:hypothetical protein [Methylicorpusculum sp.]MDP2201773.1 hypothetical protein [Methylicorpusculum sp.]